MIRVLTYSHDSFGLGHLRRTFAVGHFLARHIPQSAVLSLIGSPMGMMYFDAECVNHDYVKLPSIQKIGKEEYTARHLPFSLDQVTEMRKMLINGSLQTFKPDMVIIDKTPRGINDELVPGLEALKKSSPHTKIVLSLREILDDEKMVRAQWEDPDFVSWMGKVYDEIWVWGEPQIFDTVEVYDFPLSLRKITHYMGYLPPDPCVSNYEKLRAKAGVTSDRQHLLLLTGGGGGDAFPFFKETINGLIKGGEDSVRVLAVAGPLMGEKEFEQLRALARPIKNRVRVVRFLTHFEDWLRASDAIICMGGYNTMREIASLGKPTLVIPRRHPRREQEIRANLFSSRGWCHTVDENESITEATVKFCTALAEDNLVHSATTLGCRGFNNLINVIYEDFPHLAAAEAARCETC